ncbi:hypothetical protein BaRGS_00020802 [Batillaria attramentaria]|uniref:Uncharacterized protein n=1 Tax=Batillaria attramentaria TaxID=370345 RepID=A0ABD0KKY7_9CAEN
MSIGVEHWPPFPIAPMDMINSALPRTAPVLQTSWTGASRDENVLIFQRQETSPLWHRAGPRLPKGGKNTTWTLSHSVK